MTTGGMVVDVSQDLVRACGRAGFMRTLRTVSDSLVERGAQGGDRCKDRSEFFLKVVDAQVTFVADHQGRAIDLILHQDGQDHHAKRVDELVPMPVEHKGSGVAPKCFDGFVGGYQKFASDCERSLRKSA